MEDSRIIELYFARDEQAIEETRASYGRLIYSVAYGILEDRQESEECESDTYLSAWNSIPPNLPNLLSAYLSKISRNLALNKLRDGKRRINPELIFEELEEAIPDTEGDITEEMALRDALNRFIGELAPTKRMIFVKRYFYMREIKQISREMGISQSSVKVTLLRVRRQLREYLEKRGIVI